MSVSEQELFGLMAVAQEQQQAAAVVVFRRRLHQFTGLAAVCA